MLSVEQATERIAAGLSPVGAEIVDLAAAPGRVLVQGVAARLTQPPHRTSAMDGYAVHFADASNAGASLDVIGDSPAGRPFAGTVSAGQAVRIFTGGTVPDGADTILIQENARAGPAARRVTVVKPPTEGEHVLPAGGDFTAGMVGLAAGTVLSVRDIGLAAAMNHPSLRVRRQPVVAVLSTGDEIVRPGEPMRSGQIVSSNGPALCALVSAFGGVPRDLGVAGDTAEELRARAQDAQGADLLVTSGGASVGDHDLVGDILGGGALDFWKIAMRPGKPLMFGRCGAVPLLGLPGNPVSNLVCGLLFLRTAMQTLLGAPRSPLPLETARLVAPVGANAKRAHYMRADLDRSGDGPPLVAPAASQLSSRLSILTRSNTLLVRPPLDPVRNAGDTVKIIPFDRLGFAF